MKRSSYKRTAESLEKQRIAMTGRKVSDEETAKRRKWWEDPKNKANHREATKKAMGSSEVKATMKRGHNSKEAKANHAAAAKKVHSNPEVEARRVASLKAVWADPNSNLNSKEANAKRGAAREGKTYDELMGKEKAREVKKKRSVGAKEQWEDPDIRKKYVDAMNHPEVKKKQSEAKKRNWQDPEYISKQMVARNVSPNKPEKFLDKLLQRLFPNLWRYVGAGKSKEDIVGGRCPDFISTDGQKKIIEHFGDYYHGEGVTGVPNEQHEQERIDHFSNYGYQTLIIWEHELKNQKRLEEKIRNFSNNC